MAEDASGAPKWVPVVAPPFGVRARKLATLSISTGRVMFRSPSQVAAYDAVAVAKCKSRTGRERAVPFGSKQRLRPLERLISRAGHRPPGPECTCGFHGTLGELEAPGPEQVVLEVDLVGGLVAHGDLRRSERQRVLGIAIPRTCAATATPAAVNGGPSDSRRCGDTAVGLKATFPVIIPVCEKHAEGALLSAAAVGERADVAAYWLDEAMPFLVTSRG